MQNAKWDAPVSNPPLFSLPYKGNSRSEKGGFSIGILTLFSKSGGNIGIFGSVVVRVVRLVRPACGPAVGPAFGGIQDGTRSGVNWSAVSEEPNRQARPFG